MTSKLTILSIDPETAGEDVRRMQEALCLLEQLRQLLKTSEAMTWRTWPSVRPRSCRKPSAASGRVPGNMKTLSWSRSLPVPGRVPAPSGWLRRRQSCWPRYPPMRNGPAGSSSSSTGTSLAASAGCEN